MNTVSLCSTCYKRVPAILSIEDGSVYIVKKCSEHGVFKSMVEPSADFFKRCRGTNNIYDGYFLEVTSRCNLSCQYCYYRVCNDPDPTLDSIVDEASINRGPIILTGGEPTLRKDLPEIICEIKRQNSVELLTNGVNVTDDLLSNILPNLTEPDGTTHIHLSMHPESNGKDIELLNKLGSIGLKAGSVLFVIDDVSQMDPILSFAYNFRNAIGAVRIKAATKVWGEQKPTKRVYTSEMYDYIKKYHPEPMWWRNNKTSFFNVLLDEMPLMLVAWYDIDNIDLIDVACPPYYRARNGQIENAIVAWLVNEGMEKGWLDGKRLCDNCERKTDG